MSTKVITILISLGFIITTTMVLSLSYIIKIQPVITSAQERAKDLEKQRDSALKMIDGMIIETSDLKKKIKDIDNARKTAQVPISSNAVDVANLFSKL